jgi:glucokinase
MRHGKSGVIVLCGDIGGTHTRLAMARVEGQQVELVRVGRYRNALHPHLEDILADFLERETARDACCLAVAGPTDGRRVSFTNLDWRVDADALAQRFQFPSALLVNDFAAVGWGLESLTPPHLAPLQAGDACAGAPRVALGAGTGLGVSLCVWHGDHYRPQASEGGHIGFAPTSAEQDRLLVFLRARHGRVSVERILSGSGMVDLYRFCLADEGLADTALLAADHPAEAISQAGLDGKEDAAVRCLRLFAEIYGQTAGDLALAARASGGVFLAGGIAPKLLPLLASGPFLDGFRAKGRFTDWMRSVPVRVILDPDIGLKGAALAGLRAAHSPTGSR